MKKYRHSIRRAGDDMKNVLKFVGKHEKWSSRHRQNFVKFWGSGKEKGQAPDFGDRFNKLVEACAGAQNTLSEMIITGGTLRIIFASVTSQRSWEKRCRKTRHSRKTSSRDDPNKSEQEFHEERGELKKQFEEKGLESKALANYTPARNRIERSRRRLLQTVQIELKERCGEIAKATFEEGEKDVSPSATPIPLSPIREELAQLEKGDDGTGAKVNVPSPLPHEDEAYPPSSSGGLMGESLEKEDAGAIERSLETEKLGDLVTDLEEDVTAQDDEIPFLTNVGFVCVPFEANAQTDWPEVKNQRWTT